MAGVVIRPRKLTEALGCSTLEQVINSSADNYPLAAVMDGKSTNINAVAAGDVLDNGCFANDLDEPFARIAVLEDVANIAGGHLLVQRNANGMLEGSVNI